MLVIELCLNFIVVPSNFLQDLEIVSHTVSRSYFNCQVLISYSFLWLDV